MATPLPHRSASDVGFASEMAVRLTSCGSTGSRATPDSGSSAGARKARASPRMASSCAGGGDALTARPRRGCSPCRFHAMWIGTRLGRNRGLPLLPFYYFSGCKGSIAFSRPPRQPREAPSAPVQPVSTVRVSQRAPRLRSSPSAVRGSGAEAAVHPAACGAANGRRGGMAGRRGYTPSLRSAEPARRDLRRRSPFRRLFLKTVPEVDVLCGFNSTSANAQWRGQPRSRPGGRRQ